MDSSKGTLVRGSKGLSKTLKGHLLQADWASSWSS